MTPKSIIIALGLAAFSVACSSNSDQSGSTGIDNKPAQGGTSGAAGTNGGGSAAILVLGSGGHTTGPIADACVSNDVAKEALPVDMYIMFDQSSSMSAQVPGSNPPMSWWQTAQQAVAQFAGDPKASGIGVGIQFFPFHGLTDPNNDPSSSSSSCNIANYETPEVEIANLPGNAQAITQSIMSHAPTTFTPTAAALTGAINHMKTWGPAHAGRQPVVVLVTDGYPTECNPQDPSLIADIAKQAYEGTPKILTFVVGFEDGGGLDNLNQIAKAGGTGQAFLISGGDIGNQFVTAMLGISTTPLSCSFDVPVLQDPTQKIDFKQVWIEYIPAATRVPQPIAPLDNAGQCQSAADGWYFDAPPPNAKKILVCPQTCSKFAAGEVNIKLGCSPVLGGMH